MNTRLLTGTLGIMLVLSPLTFAQDDQKPSPTDTAKSSEAKSSGMNEDMRRAIEWERAKDRAAARQARIEARHPSNFQYADRSQNADRSVDDQTAGRPVKDTKAPGAKRDR